MLIRIYDGGADAVDVHDPSGRRRISDDGKTAVGPIYHAPRGQKVELPDDVALGVDRSGEWLDEHGNSTASQPDAGPVEGYEALSAKDIVELLKTSSPGLVAEIQAYESGLPRPRKTIVEFSPSDPATNTPGQGENQE